MLGKGVLNEWIGNRVRASIIAGFGIPGENDNRMRVVELYAERRLCVGSTYFGHKELKSMVYLVVVKTNMLHYVQYMKAVRGMGPLRSPCCTV